jgi:hypothetical protein
MHRGGERLEADSDRRRASGLRPARLIGASDLPAAAIPRRAQDALTQDLPKIEPARAPAA